MLLFLIGAGLMSAQTLSFTIKDKDNGMNLVSANQIITMTTSANGTFKRTFDIKNTSAATATFTMRKFEDLLNTANQTTAAAYFCFDILCFQPATMAATIELTAGQSFSFFPYLDEASAVGQSDVRYKFWNNADPTNDALTFTMRYNPPAGINEDVRNIAGISNAYPMPSTSNVNFDLIANEPGTISVSVINALGSMVITKSVEVKNGKNTIGVDVNELSSGIYFARFGDGKYSISKKIIITK